MIAFFRLFAWSAITAGIVVAVLGAVGYWLYREAEGPGPLTEPRTVIVPPRSGIAAVGDLLADSGVIRHGLVFRLGAGLSPPGAGAEGGRDEFSGPVHAPPRLGVIP